MDVLFYILIATSLISLSGFAGVIIFFLKDELLNKILLFLVSFASGSLTSAAFLHLIPQAIEEVGPTEDSVFKIFLFLLLGFCFFFILENFIRWHHHHTKEHPELKPFSYLILISDGIHNFIDGLTVAASFIVSIPLGIIASLTLILHEIPQEISDYGVLVYSGFEKVKALFVNFFANILAIFGGIFGFLISAKIGPSIVFLLPVAAGGFIYIAISDLIPEIKFKNSFWQSLTYFLVFLGGIGLMSWLKLLEV